MGQLVVSFVLLLTIELLRLSTAEQNAPLGGLGGSLGGFGDPNSKTIGGQFSPWSPFTPCSRSCGGGTKQRTRICLSGTNCLGLTQEQQFCNAQLCGLGLQHNPSSWNAWTPWTACTKTCGGGQQTRLRFCAAGLGCPGANREERICNVGSCQLGIWNQWTAWTVCDAACGTGRQRRTRLCIGGTCIGSNNEESHCTRGICGGTWNEWSAFSPCDRSCGGGKETRRRVCIAGTNCVGSAQEVRVCNSQSCGYGQWSDWTAFDTCTRTCGGGQQIRRRTCTGGTACPGSGNESRACNSHLCPKGLPLQRDNSWSAWTPFSVCSTTCGAGFETRQRHCISGGICPGLVKEQRPCHRSPCPIGKWTNWTPWTACTHSCNGGTERRTRVCHGGACAGDNNASRKCNLQPCTAWSSWRDAGGCSRTCGQSGVKRRTRVCPAGGCIGAVEDFVACNRLLC